MDIEEIVVGYLNKALGDFAVGPVAYFDVPRSRPSDRPARDPFIVVERTGGPRGEGGTFAPMLDLQCWASTRSAAAALALRVEDAMRAMPASVADVTGADVTSTFRDRDLESGTPRYHVICTVFCNG